MTIQEALNRYLVAWSAPSIRWPRGETLGQVLRKVFASVLAEDLVILTAAQVDELRAQLGRRGRSGGPLRGRTRELHWSAGRAFIAWCVAQRLLTQDPLALPRVQHLGQLARRLREEAGLFRRDLAQQTGVPLPTLARFETARVHLTREQLLQLLQHPCMARLPDEAKAAGLLLGLGNNGSGRP